MEQLKFVRYAHPADASMLGAIMAESFRRAFADFISLETLEKCAVAENCAGLFRQLLQSGQMNILIGGINGKSLGLLVWTERENGWTEIEAIHSLPESWGSGLGESMLDFALDETHATAGVGLWAFAENRRARRFYEKHGLQWTGERRISEFDGAEEVRYEWRKT